MNTDKSPDKGFNFLPWFAAAAIFLSLALIGFSAPRFTQIYQELEMALPFEHFEKIHWQWTIPLGFMTGLALITGARHRSERTTSILSWITIAIALLLFSAFASRTLVGHIGFVTDK